jgi:hypothetical protein
MRLSSYRAALPRSTERPYRESNPSLLLDREPRYHYAIEPNATSERRAPDIYPVTLGSRGVVDRSRRWRSSRAGRRPINVRDRLATLDSNQEPRD